MNVHNHEKKAFKDLTPEERSAIVEAWIDGNAEVYCSLDGMWADKADAYIYNNSIYRSRPRQLTIPWEHIKSEYKWAAMDECGRVCFFCGKPLCRVRDGMWENGQDWAMSPLAIDTTGIDWRESLVQRPEGV